MPCSITYSITNVNTDWCINPLLSPNHGGNRKGWGTPPNPRQERNLLHLFSYMSLPDLIGQSIGRGTWQCAQLSLGQQASYGAQRAQGEQRRGQLELGLAAGEGVCCVVYR